MSFTGGAYGKYKRKRSIGVARGGYMSGGAGHPYRYLKSKKQGKGAFQNFRKAHYASRSYDPSFGYAPKNTKRYQYAMLVQKRMAGRKFEDRAAVHNAMRDVAEEWNEIKNRPAIKGEGFRRRRR